MRERIKAKWLGVMALVAALILPGFTLAATPPAYAGTGTSINANGTYNGDFTLTKTASQPTVPFGGAEITYTYTIKNNSTATLYMASFKDDRCAKLTHVSGMSEYWSNYAGRNLWGIPAGGTSTWTCSQNITQTTTNTATLTMARGYARSGQYPYYSYYWYRPSTATAKETVTLTAAPGGLSCDNIWYSGDKYSTSHPGAIGTINTETGVATRAAKIQDLTGSAYLEGSAAVAVDPLNPRYVYFSPRSLQYGYRYSAWVYRYDILTKTAKLLNSGDTWDADISSVRLAADANGILWTISTGGVLYRMDPNATPTTRWENRGTITLPTAPGFSYTHSQLQSGDIAFDGNGTLYYITATRADGQEKGYLLTISADELAKQQPTAKLVGKMGDLGFNGIAFDSEGNAYTSSEYRIHKLNINTGQASAGVTVSGAEISDLSSCALPKPELRVTKVATPERFIHPGETLNWTVEVENIGTLGATNVMFQDTIQDATATSATLNGGANLGANYFAEAKPVNSPGALPGVIAPKSKATIVISTKVPETIISDKLAEGADAKMRICNQAAVTLTGTEGVLKSSDPNSANIQDPTCIEISGIAMQKIAPCLPDNKNEHEATFTMKVTNPGMEAIADLEVSDPQCSAAPVKVPAANVGDAAAVDDGDDLLDPGETWYYQCSLTTGEAITNTATATGRGADSQPDPAMPENDGAVEATASAKVELPGLSIEKTAKTEAGDGIASPGELITYTLTVRNDGPDKITQQGISLIDTLPQGVTYVPGSMRRTFWVNDGAGRTSFTDEPTVEMGAERELEIFARAQQPTSMITLEPFNAALPEGQAEQITVTFDAMVDETIDLSAIQSVANSAIATPEITAMQCPVAATVDNPVISKHTFTVRKTGNKCDGGEAACDKTGAEFELYGAAAQDPANPDANPQIGDLIADGIIADSITDGVTSSTFTSAKLRPGRYWLVETKAPAGFNLLAEPIVFDLARDPATGATTITLVNEADHADIVSVTPESTEDGVTTPPQIVVEDTAPTHLPQSGGGGVFLPLGVGAALVLAGWLTKTKKLPKGVSNPAGA